ncbi:hypothetical protein ORF009R [Spotted knifejaw iridovirus]|nr:hypothetical protein ORF009R [Spotted knifejaw iridovirus]
MSMNPLVTFAPEIADMMTMILLYMIGLVFLLETCTQQDQQSDRGDGASCAQDHIGGRGVTRHARHHGRVGVSRRERSVYVQGAGHVLPRAVSLLNTHLVVEARALVVEHDPHIVAIERPAVAPAQLLCGTQNIGLDVLHLAPALPTVLVHHIVRTAFTVQVRVARFHCGRRARVLGVRLGVCGQVQLVAYHRLDNDGQLRGHDVCGGLGQQHRCAVRVSLVPLIVHHLALGQLRHRLVQGDVGELLRAVQ